MRVGARMLAWISTFTLLCAVAAAGCSDDIDAPPASAEAATPDGGAGDDDAASAETCEAALEGECGACMKGSCCDALTECEGDPDCLACVNAEDSDACERNAETHARVDAYLTCKGGACASACITSEGGSCEGLLDGVTKAACAACLEGSCCDEVAACHGADVCWDGCFTNHSETKCHGDPDAHALFHAMSACVQSRCKSECAD